MPSRQKEYFTLNCGEETKEKFDLWRDELEIRWARRVTQDEVLLFLLDSVGPPKED